MVGRARRVRRTVLVHVGTVVVLTTGKTTTTWMLPVLADTTLTGRDVATAVEKQKSVIFHWIDAYQLAPLLLFPIPGMMALQ